MAKFLSLALCLGTCLTCGHSQCLLNALLNFSALANSLIGFIKASKKDSCSVLFFITISYNFLQHLLFHAAQSVDNIQISKEADSKQLGIKKATNRNTIYIGHSREAWSILSQHRILEWLNKCSSTYACKLRRYFKIKNKKTILFQNYMAECRNIPDIWFLSDVILSNLQIHRLHVVFMGFCVFVYSCLVQSFRKDNISFLLN